MTENLPVTDEVTARHAALLKLREPFADNQIGQLPKPYNKNSEKANCRECGGYHGLPAAHIDYVGHAALTDRFLDVDIEWNWEPYATDENDLPRFDQYGGLWIKLTIAGVTRLGYGHPDGKTGGNAIKEAIGDALRNSGMRYGAALDLWHKGDLHAAEMQKGVQPTEADKARESLLQTLQFKGIDPQDATNRFAADGHGELRLSTDVAAITALTDHYRSVK